MLCYVDKSLVEPKFITTVFSNHHEKKKITRLFAVWRKVVNSRLTTDSVIISSEKLTRYLAVVISTLLIVCYTTATYCFI
jgi:hypothetical protein